MGETAGDGGEEQPANTAEGGEAAAESGEAPAADGASAESEASEEPKEG